VEDECTNTVRSRYKRQVIQLKKNDNWPTWSGTGDSQPIFSCKQISYNENTLYLEKDSMVGVPKMRHGGFLLFSRPTGLLQRSDNVM